MTLAPDLIVIRPGPGLPAGFLPAWIDGRWYDLTRERPPAPLDDTGDDEVVAVPTGRFEVRPTDGAVAEVWEVGP
jgi:hypothetical protein